MGDKTGIEWTDATWNPVTGCTKVSQGCKHCYAERMFPRVYSKQAVVRVGKDGIERTKVREFTDVAVHPDRLDMPLRWKRPRRIFVNSMSDLFHEDVPDAFIDRAFAVMALAHRHTFQILTKRAERMRAYLSALTFERVVDACNRTTTGEKHGTDGASLSTIDGRSMKARFVDGEKSAFHGIARLPLPNVWLGVSVEDQETADERIPLLLQTPAAVRWISAEPLLGPIDLNSPGISRYTIGPEPWRPVDWVVAGGESGPGARPMHPDWARSLRDQCVFSGVRFLFKQWGHWAPVNTSPSRMFVYRDGAMDLPDFRLPDDSIGEVEMSPLGKKAAGRELDGVTWDQYPA